MSAGKGDRPRPVDKARYDDNYERINWGKSHRRNSDEKAAKSGQSGE